MPPPRASEAVCLGEVLVTKFVRELVEVGYPVEMLLDLGGAVLTNAICYPIDVLLPHSD
jgi:hypothetical protein